jgi:hypothetical protein
MGILIDKIPYSWRLPLSIINKINHLIQDFSSRGKKHSVKSHRNGCAPPLQGKNTGGIVRYYERNGFTRSLFKIGLKKTFVIMERQCQLLHIKL